MLETFRNMVNEVFLKLDNQTFKIRDGILKIPLKMGDYQKSFLSDFTLKLGSVTVTASTVTVVFSKAAEVIEPKGYVAIDTNERSLIVQLATETCLGMT